MKISEIFLSIDGEGVRTGYPVTFIRSHGCPLRCTYCDSEYAVKGTDFDSLSVDEIMAKLQIWSWCKRVTFTGGEPLIQADALDLIKTLLVNGYEVNIETCGAVDLRPLVCDETIQNHRNRLIITMDWKSISSGMHGEMLFSNLMYLDQPQDVLKFVVGSLEDLDQMAQLVSTAHLDCSIFVSPVFGAIEPVDIVNYILQNQLADCRVQLQLHKMIWDPNKRGV